MPLTQALTNIGYVGVAVVSGWLCINGRLSIGMIQSFIQYLRQFSQPINQVSNIANIMQATMLRPKGYLSSWMPRRRCRKQRSRNSPKSGKEMWISAMCGSATQRTGP